MARWFCTFVRASAIVRDEKWKMAKQYYELRPQVESSFQRTRHLLQSVIIKDFHLGGLEYLLRKMLLVYNVRACLYLKSYP